MATPPKKISGGLLPSILHMGAALRYSLQGLLAAARLSLSFRQELLVLVLLCGLLAFFCKPAWAWLLCLGGWSAVLVAELLNTAVEATLDLISKDYSSVIRDAKDMCSAAVLILLFFSAASWLYVFWPELLAGLALFS